MPFPNVGELEALEALISRKTVQLILYKNLVVPTDGALTMASLVEMPTGSGRGYAPKQLARTINYSGLVASQWYLSLNAAGKGQAQYSNAAQQWTMTSVDVGDANTVQGMAGFCWKLPFKNGAVEIKEGYIVLGNSSGAMATVTGVLLLTGTWGGGTAAGYLYLETKTGTFQNGENLTVSGASGAPTYAVSDSGATGDAWKQLMFLNAMGTPTQVTQVGQPFTTTPILTMAQDPTMS